MFYFVKIPWIIKKIFPSLVFNIFNDKKVVYLTFDDGPIPETTSTILDVLDSFNAKSTFFCLGKNIEKYPEEISSLKYNPEYIDFIIEQKK